MAGLSDKEAAFLAAARAEMADKSAEQSAPAQAAAGPGAGATAPADAPRATATAAPVAVDPMERIAALIEAERAATAAKRERQRLIYLAVPAVIAFSAALWIFFRLLSRI